MQKVTVVFDKLKDHLRKPVGGIVNERLQRDQVRNSRVDYRRFAYLMPKKHVSKS